MGRTAVLEVGGSLFLQLTELPVWTIDPDISLRGHARRAKFLVVKSQGSFKA
jgi:hypothetical protein